MRIIPFLIFLLNIACSQFVNDIPKLNNGIMDQVKIFTPAHKMQLDNAIWQLEQDTGSQLAILIISSTQGESIDQYAVRVFEAWQLGRKGIDDGVLLVVAINDKTARIEVGYGLEGAITDVIASDIIRQSLFPDFKQGKYDLGIEKGTHRLIELIRHEVSTLQPLKQQTSIITGLLVICLLIGASLIWLSSIYQMFHRNKIFTIILWSIFAYITYTYNPTIFTGNPFFISSVPQWQQSLMTHHLPSWFAFVLYYYMFLFLTLPLWLYIGHNNLQYFFQEIKTHAQRHKAKKAYKNSMKKLKGFDNSQSVFKKYRTQQPQVTKEFKQRYQIQCWKLYLFSLFFTAYLTIEGGLSKENSLLAIIFITILLTGIFFFCQSIVSDKPTHKSSSSNNYSHSSSTSSSYSYSDSYSSGSSSSSSSSSSSYSSSYDDNRSGGGGSSGGGGASDSWGDSGSSDSGGSND